MGDGMDGEMTGRKTVVIGRTQEGGADSKVVQGVESYLGDMGK